MTKHCLKIENCLQYSVDCIDSHDVSTNIDKHIDLDSNCAKNVVVKCCLMSRLIRGGGGSTRSTADNQ